MHENPVLLRKNFKDYKKQFLNWILFKFERILKRINAQFQLFYLKQWSF